MKALKTGKNEGVQKDMTALYINTYKQRLSDLGMGFQQRRDQWWKMMRPVSPFHPMGLSF
jgi:hypothetical protein